MSFVSTNNKSGMGGLTTTTPPITGESGGVTADSVAGSVADAAESAVEQAADRYLAHCRSHQDW